MIFVINITISIGSIGIISYIIKVTLLKKVTALQIFKGVKKGGEQIIKDSDKVVIFKMDNGQEFITNGYFMIKKGYDKAMDEMLVKFADKVQVIEQKMKTFYTGYKSDYAIESIEHIIKYNLLEEDGIIVVETDDKNKIDEIKKLNKLEVYDTRKYGIVLIIFIRKG